MREGAWRHQFNPDGEFVVRKALSTDRYYVPGETFNKSSVTPRRLRQLHSNRVLLPAESVPEMYRVANPQGPITARALGEPRQPRALLGEQPPPPAPTEGDEAPPRGDEPLTRDELIAQADSMPFPTWRKAALEVLGRHAPRQKTKAKILAALERL